MEGAHRRGAIVERVPDRGHRQPGIEPGRRVHQRTARPQPVAGLGQALPGELRAGIDLAPWREVGMADHLRFRDRQARGQVIEQAQQGSQLWFGVGLAAGVVDLDADRRRVQFGHRAPTASAGLPGAVAVGDQLVDAAIVADQVVRAHRPLAVARAQRVQAFRGRLLLGGVQHDELRPARIEVRRRHPFGERIALRGMRACREQQDEGGERQRQAGTRSSVHACIAAATRRRCKKKSGQRCRCPRVAGGEGDPVTSNHAQASYAASPCEVMSRPSRSASTLTRRPTVAFTMR